VLRFVCVWLIAWLATWPGESAAQPAFSARAAEFDLRAKQLEMAREPEARGRATLEWLRALQAALQAVSFERVEKAERDWLDAHENLVAYSEPAGAWLIQDNVLWAAHEKNRTSSAADEIAWLAVVNGLPGECEGHVPCYAFVLDRLEGEYLRRHPQGRHRGEALEKVDEMLTIVVDDLLQRPDAAHFLKVPDDCADMFKSLRPLQEAVATAGDPQTMKTLGLIDRLMSFCPAVDDREWTWSANPGGEARRRGLPSVTNFRH